MLERGTTVEGRIYERGEGEKVQKSFLSDRTRGEVTLLTTKRKRRHSV